MKERPHILPALPLLLSALPIVIYFFFTWQYVVNIPSWDDYDFLESVLKIIETDDSGRQFSLIFEKHVESRMAFIRVLFLLSFAALGEIDIKLILFISNTALLGLLFIFFNSRAPFGNKLLFFLPVILILFQLQNWHNMIWIAATHHYLVLYFSGASLFWITKNSTKSFFLASLHAVIAPFTLGGGLGAPILGVIYLFSTKRIKEGVIWAAGGLLLFIFYFYNYETASQDHGLTSFLANPGQNFLYFFSFLGSILAFKNFSVSIFLGLICLSYFIYLSLNKYYLKNPFIYLFIAWIIFSALTASFFRSEIGLDQSLSYRYKIYSASFLILIYLSITDVFSFSEKLKQSVVISAIALTSILYIGSAMDALPKMKFQKGLLNFRTNHWVIHNHGLFFYDPPEANRTLVSSIQSGIYKLPQHILSVPDEFYSQRVLNNETCQKNRKLEIVAGFNGFTVRPESRSHFFRLEGVVSNFKNMLSGSDAMVIVLKSESDLLLFSTRPQEKMKISIHFQKGSTNKGFIGLIPFEDLNKGPYQIGLCYQNQTIFYNQFIDQAGSSVFEKNN
jgi:hypothetical protein